MDAKANPAPGFRDRPEKSITIEPFHGLVVVTFADAIIASSKRAKVLREDKYPAAFYIPFEDIYFDFLTPTATSTYCPFKGDASYWSVAASGEGEADVMWAYRQPYDEMESIRDHGAFYPNKVSIEATPNGA
jgi:uncharacterized protein (DUF427 family)